ncbi:MAG: hypothetical protein ACPGMR_11775 [Pontibacterium sp.]
MKATHCSQCQSNALNRVKRGLLTRMRHPESRCYQCAECGHKMLVNKMGDLINEPKEKDDSNQTSPT